MHDLQVFYLFSRVYILNAGETMFSGTPIDAVSHFLGVSTSNVVIPEELDSGSPVWEGESAAKLSNLIVLMEDACIPRSVVLQCLDAATVEQQADALIHTLHDYQNQNTTTLDRMEENPADMILDVMLDATKAVPFESLREAYDNSGIYAEEKRYVHSIDSAGEGPIDRFPPSAATAKFLRFCTRVWVAEVKFLSSLNNRPVVLITLTDSVLMTAGQGKPSRDVRVSDAVAAHTDCGCGYLRWSLLAATQLYGIIEYTLPIINVGTSAQYCPSIHVNDFCYQGLQRGIPVCANDNSCLPGAGGSS